MIIISLYILKKCIEIVHKPVLKEIVYFLSKIIILTLRPKKFPFLFPEKALYYRLLYEIAFLLIKSS